MFAASISSKSRGKGDRTPNHHFVPDLARASVDPHIALCQPTSRSPPPSNLIESGNVSTDESKQTAGPSTTRTHRQTAKLSKQKELFSDCIGNASSFVSTSSFEAKVAMEPAAHTFHRWMAAAKDNIERFKTLPEPAEHNFEASASSTDMETSVNPSAGSADALDQYTDPSLGKQVGDHTGMAETEKPPVRPSFWKLWTIWMLATVSEIRPRPRSAMSGTIRRFCEAANQYPSPLPNSSVSFFQPAFHPSLLVFSRGYATATKRGLKRRTHGRRNTARAQGKLKPASVPKDKVERPNPRPPPKKSPFIHEVSSDIDAPYILIPAPATQNELCNALRYLIQSTEPPASLPRLIVTHTQYPTLQSAESYNILLAHASRVAPVPYSSQICERIYNPDGGNRPSARRKTMDRWGYNCRGYDDDGESCWKLFPTGVTVDVISRSPRIAYNVVRLLVNTGLHEQALQLCRKLLESLEFPTPANIRYCRAILCHVIRPPRGHPSAHLFMEQYQLFDSLLQHNRSLGLTPDPSLTCALLQNLRKRHNRGPIAFHTLLELRAKYGPQVENGAVRRIIARYAIDEEKFDLAHNMLKRESLTRTDGGKQSQSPPSEPKAPWVGQSALPTQSHLEYLRNKGIENRKFTATARSLRRRESKLGKRVQPCPENMSTRGERGKQSTSIHPNRKRCTAGRTVSLTSNNNKEKDT
ncbi:hypothetical protein RhiXN_01793 [Rhizoctonia solani]|uniref:Uncharacterized protein n=1 Tax=Rhizoctonia solani TaxID=456999 RepID=A0A8H8P9B8_9AGAM|nr:uncharacterized protein RhiXN_01793 [Rhizoctonia solani]QRW27198.1 hypothetical protein RhiXN_01793 [Rhizoctonia solani]